MLIKLASAPAVPKMARATIFLAFFGNGFLIDKLGRAYSKDQGTARSKRRRTGALSVGWDPWIVPRDDPGRMDRGTLSEPICDRYRDRLPRRPYHPGCRQPQQTRACALTGPFWFFQRPPGCIDEQPGCGIRTTHRAFGDVFLSCLLQFGWIDRNIVRCGVACRECYSVDPGADRLHSFHGRGLLHAPWVDPGGTKGSSASFLHELSLRESPSVGPYGICLFSHRRRYL